MNAFNVPLAVFRNRCWLQPFALYGSDQLPWDVSADNFALVVIPSALGPTNGAAPVFANVSPTIQINVVAFDTPDTAMGTLTAGKPYTWQLLHRPNSGDAACTSVLCAGPLTVSDSPPFPAINPY